MVEKRINVTDVDAMINGLALLMSLVYPYASLPHIALLYLALCPPPIFTLFILLRLFHH